MGAPLLLALTAGMVAAINPCGFALLPAYVGFFVTSEQENRSLDSRILRAILGALTVTMGFVVVFVVLGVVLTSAAARVQGSLPWVTIAIGSVLVVAGIMTVAGRKVALPAIALRRASGRGVVGMASFGIVYALASLSCTIGPFVAVTTASLGRSTLDGVAAYVVYGLGMGVIILAIGTSAALARPRPVTHLRWWSRRAPQLGGGLMIISGLYAIWYARWELSVYAGDLRTDRAIQFGERWRLTVVGWIERIGPLELALIIVGLVALTFLVVETRRPSDTSPMVLDNPVRPEERAQ